MPTGTMMTLRLLGQPTRQPCQCAETICQVAIDDCGWLDYPSQILSFRLRGSHVLRLGAAQTVITQGAFSYGGLESAKGFDFSGSTDVFATGSAASHAIRGSFFVFVSGLWTADCWQLASCQEMPM